MSENSGKQEEGEEIKKKKKSGLVTFLGISQSTFINQQFNRALWKCFNYYHEEFQKQYKEKRNPIQIRDFFESDETHQYENMSQVENYCAMKMKTYADSHFVNETKLYTDCRAECEALSSSSGKIMAFIKNERCFKRCRLDFDKDNREKVAQVFSKYVPQLNDLIENTARSNRKKEEDQKIEEIKQQYAKQQ